MKESSKITASMEMALLSILTMTFIQANLKIIRSMDKDNISLAMEIYMRDNLKMI